MTATLLVGEVLQLTAEWRRLLAVMALDQFATLLREATGP